MAWIKMIQEDEAEGELKEMYDQNVEPWGGVDNILKIHSLSPESLKAHISLYKTVMYGKSPIRRRVSRTMIQRLNGSKVNRFSGGTRCQDEWSPHEKL